MLYKTKKPRCYAWLKWRPLGESRIAYGKRKTYNRFAPMTAAPLLPCVGRCGSFLPPAGLTQKKPRCYAWLKWRPLGESNSPFRIENPTS